MQVFMQYGFYMFREILTECVDNLPDSWTPNTTIMRRPDNNNANSDQNSTTQSEQICDLNEKMLNGRINSHLGIAWIARMQLVH
jgi:hypothetical protein